MFSIADVQNAPEEGFEAEEGVEGEEPPAEVYPIRCSFSITKVCDMWSFVQRSVLMRCPFQASGPGALNIDALCQEGSFLVDNVSFYPDASLGTDLTAEADWKRRGVYIGPQFDTLDVGVQEEFEKFLAERGIDERLALFIPEFSEYKEQKVRDMSNVGYVWWELDFSCLVFHRSMSSGLTT
jgi:complement component 1 Q subcomponent-binding protein, mitochondrial